MHLLISLLASGGSPPDYYASGQGHPHSSYVAQYAHASSYGALSYGYTGQESKWLQERGSLLNIIY